MCDAYRVTGFPFDASKESTIKMLDLETGDGGRKIEKEK